MALWGHTRRRRIWTNFVQQQRRNPRARNTIASVFRRHIAITLFLLLQFSCKRDIMHKSEINNSNQKLVFHMWEDSEDQQKLVKMDSHGPSHGGHGGHGHRHKHGQHRRQHRQVEPSATEDRIDVYVKRDFNNARHHNNQNRGPPTKPKPATMMTEIDSRKSSSAHSKTELLLVYMLIGGFMLENVSRTHKRLIWQPVEVEVDHPISMSFDPIAQLSENPVWNLFQDHIFFCTVQWYLLFHDAF
jgi:hypothetical protein